MMLQLVVIWISKMLVEFFLVDPSWFSEPADYGLNQLDAFNLAEFDVEGWNVFSSFDVSFHDQQSCGNGG